MRSGSNLVKNALVAECCAAILRIALNIVRLQDDEHSIKGRTEIAAMTDEYLLGLLANVIGKFLKRKC